MMQNLTLENNLAERASALAVKAGRKARIIVTDDIANNFFSTIAREVADFAELIPVDVSNAKEKLAEYKGYKDDPPGKSNWKSRIDRVDQTLTMMLQAFGISEQEILPFISASLELKSKKADALLGGIDAPTEALIAGCSLVLDYTTPSAVFFTQVRQVESIGIVKKYSDQIAAITLPDGREVIVAYPPYNFGVSGIVEAVSRAYKYVIDPVIAFISFSTAGNANHSQPELMKSAAEIYSRTDGRGNCFGDIQVDASLDRQVMLKKLNGEDPFKGRTANCLIYSDATSAHSFIDYFEWAYNNYENREGEVIAIGDMAIKPEPNTKQLAQIITDSISTYKLVVDEDPAVALIAHNEKSKKKFQEAIQILPDNIKTYLCNEEPVTLKEALSEANLFLYSELAHGNPAYKAWQILNPGFFVTQGFDMPVCDLSRGDSNPDKIKSTIAYLTIQSLESISCEWSFYSTSGL